MTELLYIVGFSIAFAALVAGFLFFICADLSHRRDENKDDCDP